METIKEYTSDTPEESSCQNKSSKSLHYREAFLQEEGVSDFEDSQDQNFDNLSYPKLESSNTAAWSQYEQDLKMMAQVNELAAHSFELQAFTGCQKELHRYLARKCNESLNQYSEFLQSAETKLQQQIDALALQVEEMDSQMRVMKLNVSEHKKESTALLNKQNLYSFFERVIGAKKKCCYSYGFSQSKDSLSIGPVRDEGLNRRHYTISTSKFKLKYQVNQLVESNIEIMQPLSSLFLSCIHSGKSRKYIPHLVINIISLSRRFGLYFLNALLQQLSCDLTNEREFNLKLSARANQRELGDIKLKRGRNSSAKKSSQKQSQTLLNQDQQEIMEDLLKTTEEPIHFVLHFINADENKKMAKAELLFHPRSFASLLDSIMELKKGIFQKWPVKGTKTVESSVNSKEHQSDKESSVSSTSFFQKILKGKVVVLSVIDLMSNFEGESRKETTDLLEAVNSLKYE